MKNKNNLLAIILVMAFTACQTTPEVPKIPIDKEKIKTEVMQIESNLLNALREGELMNGLSIHLNAPDYRNIWNGEIKTFDVLQTQIQKGMEKGLKSIDYKVQSRDFNIINEDNVLVTLTSTETTTMVDSSSATSGLTAVTLLWQRIENVWKLGYLHASELPKAN